MNAPSEIKCPHCGSHPGHPCRDGSYEYKGWYHVARTTAADGGGKDERRPRDTEDAPRGILSAKTVQRLQEFEATLRDGKGPRRKLELVIEDEEDLVMRGPLGPPLPEFPMPNPITGEWLEPGEKPKEGDMVFGVFLSPHGEVKVKKLTQEDEDRLSKPGRFS